MGHERFFGLARKPRFTPNRHTAINAGSASAVESRKGRRGRLLKLTMATAAIRFPNQDARRRSVSLDVGLRSKELVFLSTNENQRALARIIGKNKTNRFGFHIVSHKSLFELTDDALNLSSQKSKRNLEILALDVGLRSVARTSCLYGNATPNATMGRARLRN